MTFRDGCEESFFVKADPGSNWQSFCSSSPPANQCVIVGWWLVITVFHLQGFVGNWGQEELRWEEIYRGGGGLIHLIGGSRCGGRPSLRPSNTRTQRWCCGQKKLHKLSWIAISLQIISERVYSTATRMAQSKLFCSRFDRPSLWMQMLDVFLICKRCGNSSARGSWHTTSNSAADGATPYVSFTGRKVGFKGGGSVNSDWTMTILCSFSELKHTSETESFILWSFSGWKAFLCTSFTL